jgi:hypothetical protein
MKTVFKSSELPHLWAHGKITNGTCPSAMSVSGSVLKSYATAIAERVGNDTTGKDVYYLLNGRSFSVTTSSHQSDARRAIPHGALVFTLEADRGSYKLSGDSRKATGDAVFCYAVRRSAEMQAKAPRATANKEYYEAEALAWLNKAAEASDFFGLRRKVDGETVARLVKAEKAARAKLEKRRKEEQARRDAAAREQVEDWLTGVSNFYPYNIGGGDRLRVVGEIGRKECHIETSKGIRLEARIAEVSWRFIIRHRSQGWHRNGETFAIGDWQLDAVNADGIVAGCHRVSWTEIDRVAKLAGWEVLP